MKAINILVLTSFILLVACSTNKQQRKVIVPEGEPEWLYAPQSGCSETFICTSGEGESFTSSDVASKKSMASIFETQIDASFKYSKKDFSSDELNEMKEIVNSGINEKVNGVLKGVVIKERFSKDGLKFSLASLNKSKAYDLLKDEINRLDSKISHFYTIGSKLYLKKLYLLLNERNLLNEKLVILNGSGISTTMTFKKISNLRNKSNGYKVVKIKQSNKSSAFINKKIKELLLELGYEIAEKNNDYFINLNFSTKEEFLNVKGFKRFSFIYEITATTNLGKKLGSIVIDVTQNGRNKEDAFLKAKKQIVSKIGTNITKLNLK